MTAPKTSRPAESAWNPTTQGSTGKGVPGVRRGEAAAPGADPLEAADRIEAAHETAADLICAVRDVDRVRVAQLVHGADLPALVVLLAAMVPDNATVSDLLGWTAGLPEPTLAPHGSHAAYNRHVGRSEQPCQMCIDGERMYQRVRYARRKRQRQAVAS